MSDNATSFGRQAVVYANGRPGYPPALFDWIAEHSPAQDHVWDVATGSGQAAQSLAKHFGHVHATDVSVDQISQARATPNITYGVAPAEHSGLPAASVDAVTVATALHWFAQEPFWAEVSRAARPGALFCAWSYPLPSAPQAVQQSYLDPVYALIDPYWAPGNRLAMAGYSAANTRCPFEIINTPPFDAGGAWSPERLVAFARSWSAHHRARKDGCAEALHALDAAFLDQFGRDTEIRMPLTVLAARIG